MAVGLIAGWNLSWQLGRWLRRKRFSGLLVLGLLGLILRAAVSLVLNSPKLFFLAPAVVTSLTGVIYIGSALLSRPLLSAVMSDLIPPSVVDLSGTCALPVVKKLSVLYGSEQVLVAVVSILMVLRLSTSQYVIAHTIASWSSFGVATTIAIAFFRREVAVLVPREVLDHSDRPATARPGMIVLGGA